MRAKRRQSTTAFGLPAPPPPAAAGAFGRLLRVVSGLGDGGVVRVGAARQLFRRPRHDLIEEGVVLHNRLGRLAEGLAEAEVHRQRPADRRPKIDDLLDHGGLDRAFAENQSMKALTAASGPRSTRIQAHLTASTPSRTARRVRGDHSFSSAAPEARRTAWGLISPDAWYVRRDRISVRDTGVS